MRLMLEARVPAPALMVAQKVIQMAAPPGRIFALSRKRKPLALTASKIRSIRPRTREAVAQRMVRPCVARYSSGVGRLAELGGM